jgi:hypothetical protein
MPQSNFGHPLTRPISFTDSAALMVILRNHQSPDEEPNMSLEVNIKFTMTLKSPKNLWNWIRLLFSFWDWFR